MRPRAAPKAIEGGAGAVAVARERGVEVALGADGGAPKRARAPRNGVPRRARRGRGDGVHMDGRERGEGEGWGGCHLGRVMDWTGATCSGRRWGWDGAMSWRVDVGERSVLV